MYRYAILKELDYLCKLILGCRYRLMLPVVTRTLAEHKTREESVREDQERAILCGNRTQKLFPFPSFALSIAFICIKADRYP